VGEIVGCTEEVGVSLIAQSPRRPSIHSSTEVAREDRPAMVALSCTPNTSCWAFCVRH
jgi:hypothetical protein